MRKDWRDVYYIMINNVLQETTNDWENEFCKSVEVRLKKGYSLTERQIKKLEELNEKYS